MNILSLDPESVIILPDRQRKDIGDISDLCNSISEMGQLQPIIVRKKTPGESPLEGWVLVAGERRLRSCRHLKIEVFAVDFGTLDPLSQQLIELEENIKRKDLTWQERADAINKIHVLHSAQDETWTQEKTAKALGLSPGTISRHIAVAGALQSDDLVKGASGFSAAANLIARKTERQLNAVLDELLFKPEESTPGEEPKPALEDPVLCADFIQFASSYSGPKFNLIHCDFPYGVGMGTNALQDTRADFVRYEDTADIYWKLVRELVANIERLASPQCHILFWYSMNYHAETVNALSSIGKVNPFPLIWHKSDNTGLLPDPQRGPRRVYETALLVSRGDRKIVRPVSNCVSYPAAKDAAEHLSEKPVNVLLAFLPMLVDDTTKLLDPTAGSGTSLIAAKKLGAASVRGLELNQGFVDIANRKYWREL